MKLDVLIGMLQYGYAASGRLPTAVRLHADDYDAIEAECEARGIRPVKEPGLFDPDGVITVIGQRPRIELTTSDGTVLLEREGLKRSPDRE